MMHLHNALIKDIQWFQLEEIQLNNEPVLHKEKKLLTKIKR